MFISDELVERLPDSREEVILNGRSLVTYLVRRFINKFCFVRNDYDDLVQDGVIGLIRAVDTFDPVNGTAFTTYASKCVVNEIYQYLRRHKHNFDYTVLCDDLYGLSAPEQHFDLNVAYSFLPENERKIISLRFGGCARQKETARYLNISEREVFEIEKQALNRLRMLLDCDLPTRTRHQRNGKLKGDTYFEYMLETGADTAEAARHFNTTVSDFKKNIKYAKGFNIAEYFDKGYTLGQIAEKEGMKVCDVAKMVGL